MKHLETTNLDFLSNRNGEISIAWLLVLIEVKNIPYENRHSGYSQTPKWGGVKWVGDNIDNMSLVPPQSTHHSLRMGWIDRAEFFQLFYLGMLQINCSSHICLKQHTNHTTCFHKPPSQYPTYPRSYKKYPYPYPGVSQ